MKRLLLTCLVASVIAAPSEKIKRNILPGDPRYDVDQHQIHGVQKPQENESEIAHALGKSGLPDYAVSVAAPKAAEDTPHSGIVSDSIAEADVTTIKEPVGVIAQPEASADVVQGSGKSYEQVQLNEKATNLEAKHEGAASETTYGQSQEAPSTGIAQYQEAKFVQPQVASPAGVTGTTSFGFLQPRQLSFPDFPQSPEAKYVQPHGTSFAYGARSPFGTYIQPQPAYFAGVAHSQEAKFVQPKEASPFGFAQRPVTEFFQPQQPSFAGFAQNHGAKYVQPQVTSFGHDAQSPFGTHIQPQPASFAGAAHSQEAKFVQPKEASLEFTQRPVTGFFQPQQPSFAGFAQNQGTKYLQPRVNSFANGAQSPFATYIQPQPASFAGLAQSQEAEYDQPKEASSFRFAPRPVTGFFQPQQPSFAGFAQSQDAKYLQPQVTSFANGVQSPFDTYIQPQPAYFAGVEQSQENKFVQPGFSAKSGVESLPQQEQVSFVTPASKEDEKLRATPASEPAEGVSGTSGEALSGVTATPIFNTVTTFPNGLDSSFRSTIHPRFGSQVGSTFPASSFGAAAPQTPGFNSYDHTRYNNPQYQSGYGYHPGFGGYKGSNQYYNNYQYNKPGSYDQFSGRPFAFGTYPSQYNQAVGKPADTRYPLGSFPQSYSADYNKNFPYVQYTTPRTVTPFSTIQQTRTIRGEASKDQEQAVKSPESLVQPTAASYQESAAAQA